MRRYVDDYVDQQKTLVDLHLSKQTCLFNTVTLYKKRNAYRQIRYAFRFY